MESSSSAPTRPDRSFRPLLPARAARVARRSALLVGLAAAVLAGAGASAQERGATLPRLRAGAPIVIGHRTDGMPMAYLDAAGRPVGFGLDVCADVVARLRADLRLPGLRAEYTPVTAANRIEAVKSGRVDLECGLTINTRERRRDVAFAMPYYFAGPRILARADAGIRDFQDLSGKRIVSTKGAAAVPLLRERIERRLLDSVLIEVANNDAAFAMLERGEVNAFVTTDILLYAYKATARTPTQWVVTGAHLAVEPMAIAVRKGDPEFKAAVDRVLSAQMLDGTMARLYARWFDAPIPPAGVVLGIKPSAPLREQWRWPSERTADEGPE